MQWQRLERPRFGYAIQVPAGWEERPPDLRNSPSETGRYVDPTDHRHSVIVFRNAMSPGQDSVFMAERAQRSLTSSGFVDFQLRESELAGLPATRLDFARRDAGRVWAVTEYFLVRDRVGFCLGCGSAVPDEDEPLFTTIAGLFELIPTS